MHGDGTFLHHGYMYKGQWLDGRREGKGAALYPSGARYLGNFAEDKVPTSSTNPLLS